MSIPLGHLIHRDWNSPYVVTMTDVARYLSPYIDGIEVTQGIQHYHSDRHLSRASDRGRDNSVRLVAGKPAWARVYVRSGAVATSVFGITGKLEVLRRTGMLNWEPVTTLGPRAPGIVTALQNPSYNAERSNVANTLNFVIPPRTRGLLRDRTIEVLCGHLRLRATITAPDGRTDTMEVDVDATLEQTLRLRGIMVSYNGPASSAPTAPNLTLAAPTLADLRTTAAWALLTFPVQSRVVVSSGGTLPLTTHLQDTVMAGNAGGCSPNWNALLTALQAQRTNDGNRDDWIYYGLLPAATPVGGGTGTNTGCGDLGLGAGPVGFGVAMAHELAHACDVKHAPCGPVGTTSARLELSYPAYEPYETEAAKRASIGEYGLDISTGNVFPPNTFRDFMSYCGPSWISLYTHELLYNNDQLAPRWVCRDESYWDEVMYDRWWWLPSRHIPDPPPDPWKDGPVILEPLISIIGVVHGSDRVDVQSVMRVDAMRRIRNGAATELTAELVGADGNVVARERLVALRDQASGCGCPGGEATASPYPYVFQALVPSVEPGVALVIRHDDRELWSRQASETPPAVSALRARLTRNRVTLTWRTRTSSAVDTEAWVQWSNDRGRTWHAVTAGVRRSEVSFPPSVLPPGRVQLRVLVSDGFYTTASSPAALQVPRRPPEVSVLTPRPGQTLQAGHTMRAWGTATASTGGPLPEESARWLLDGQRLAEGFDAFIDAPQPGRHRLTLVVAADEGRTQASVEFRTVAADRGQAASR